MKMACIQMFVLSIMILLTSCGVQNRSTNPPITNSELGIGVVCNECDPSYGVGYHNHTYIITSEVVKSLGKELGSVSASDQLGVGGWHTPPIGTKLYEIVGTPVNEAIAVEISPGIYKKAVIRGWFPLSDTTK